MITMKEILIRKLGILFIVRGWGVWVVGGSGEWRKGSLEVGSQEIKTR